MLLFATRFYAYRAGVNTRGQPHKRSFKGIHKLPNGNQVNYCVSGIRQKSNNKPVNDRIYKPATWRFWKVRGRERPLETFQHH